MKTRLHALAGAVAMLCILTFWSDTAIVEVFLDHAAVAAVKRSILAAMWLLIPAMITTGATGSPDLAGTQLPRRPPRPWPCGTWWRSTSADATSPRLRLAAPGPPRGSRARPPMT